MEISYESNNFISLGNDEVLGLSDYDLDYPFNFFIDDIELERQIIPDSSNNPANISENENIFVEINKYQDFSQSSNIKDSASPFSGRKRKNKIKEGEKKHDKYSNDNILRKLNIHFLNFLIVFINEVLHNCNIDKKFNNINYEDKRKISKKDFYKIKNETIRSLLNLQNDKKFNNYNRNKQLYDIIFKNSDNKVLNRILNKRYIDIFKEIYYNNKKNLFYEGNAKFISYL